ncbi:uncharacterized protein LOC111700002 isoform X2 [Eurytemora carolleeae]|nr:uncharacterized protein LOC111700002 isoform X2 [Eurytemora carolleeae]|eukprot:XP_023326577.1 uncharacterized protein LOC111700002 isoform X2 [Eurytemora affinis]
MNDSKVVWVGVDAFRENMSRPRRLEKHASFRSYQGSGGDSKRSGNSSQSSSRSNAVQVSPTSHGSKESMITCDASNELKDELSNNGSEESSILNGLETGEELRSRFFREIQAELDQTTEWNNKISVLKSLLAGVGQSNSEDEINFSDSVPVEKKEIDDQDQVDQVGQAQIQGSHHDLNSQLKPASVTKQARVAHKM